LNEPSPFNPLDKKNLAASVAEALLLRREVNLGKLDSFSGAGIYAIYYEGEFPLYEPLVSRNKGRRLGTPIYVGKAIPQGGRKGGKVLLDGAVKTRALFNRLSEHAESIQSAKNLDIRHFSCRYLTVDDIWIPLGEALLIAKFAPLWNNIIDGFGNHDPGKGRYEGMRPRWDVLHPGREWAERCKPRAESTKQIVADVEQFLRSQPEPPPQMLETQMKLASYDVSRPKES
jgi:hypothetical protein